MPAWPLTAEIVSHSFDLKILQLTSIAHPFPSRTEVRYQSTKARFKEHPEEASAVKREAATWMALWKDCASVKTVEQTCS